MRCDNCGRMIQNEEANFCEYCGSSFREQRQAPNHIASKEQENQRDNRIQYTNTNMYGSVPNQGLAPAAEGQEKPGSFLSWLGLYGLLFVPFVGWILFLIIVFLWAFGNNTTVSKKNWARATLVFIGVLAVIFIIFMAVMLISYAPMYQEIYGMIENGTFNNSSYMDLLKKYY